MGLLNDDKAIFSLEVNDRVKGLLINYLKNTFKYIAIMMIISIVLYGVAFIFIALAALKSGL